MIDIDELRRLAQAVQGSPRNIHERVNAIHNLHDAMPSGVVLEILDRLEAAEKERDDVAQQLVQSEQGKRKISEECDALRAKIEAMERQGPVRWFYVTNDEWDCYSRERPPKDAYAAGSLMALYALPGAKGESE